MHMRLACRPSAPRSRHLSLAWTGLSDDGLCFEDSAQSSWGKHVVAHAQGALETIGSGVRVPKRARIGIGNFRCLYPNHLPKLAAVTSPDRVLAHNLIQRIRGEIPRHLKTAFRELVMIE